MKKFLCGVYVGASAVFIYGMMIEIHRLSENLSMFIGNKE